MSIYSGVIAIAFLSLGFAIVFASFLIKNKIGLFYKIPSQFLLISGSIFFSLGLLEFSLSVSNSNWESDRSFPPAPEFLVKYRASSYTLIHKSILYIAPPSSYMNRDFSGFRTFGVRYETNEMGFREKEFQLKKADGKFRILIFGDSFTFGIGVHESQRYTNVLETMLNRLTQDKRFEVLNFGMPGYSTDQEHDMMKAILKIVDCDLVILGFCCNDLNITTQKVLKENTTLNIVKKPFPFTFNLNGTEVPIYQNHKRNFNNLPEEEPSIFFSDKNWYENSMIYRFLEQRTNININGKLPNRVRWNYALNEFRGINRLTKQYKLPRPVVVLLNFGNVDPHKNNFRYPKGELAQYIRLYQFVGKELKQEGFHVVDTLPLFKKFSGMSMANSEWEHHPNYLGHYIYAKSIADSLIINELIDLREINCALYDCSDLDTFKQF